ncbi:GNAT family N-acetyltransferase [Candidatus Clostridium radicumherbarum]|uniref:GNAT family N-acetyltransferase n=1 Tax=Candidatus Clostridium radicumherbarum TaxID=3381662 RepID=A0ABW8TVB9_9CLOT
MSRLIRYANLNDTDILGKIHSESSREGFKGIIPDYILNDIFSIERRTKRFISEISEGSPRTAVVFEKNEPAGLISFGKCRSGINDKLWIEIWRVYLTPKFWGRGVAKELIEWGINEIQKENFSNIELWVLEENIRARKFYEKMGFKHDNTVQITNMGKELKELRYIRA